MTTNQTSVLLAIWPQCLQKTLSEAEQSKLIGSSLEESTSLPAIIKLGLASSHTQLIHTAVDTIIARVKRGGSQAVDAVTSDTDLLTLLSRPELLPRLANTRLFQPICQRLVKAIRQQTESSSKQSSKPISPSTASRLPAVLQCPICQAHLSGATEADVARHSAFTSLTNNNMTLLPMSLAHLVTYKLYPQAVHLLYSVLQTHEYMRSMPAGLAEVRARLQAASKDAMVGLDEEGGQEQLALYESALSRMKDDGVGQSR